MIAGCLVVWMAAIVLLAIGWKTRVAAVVVWAMSLSFANVQSSIDNAGDTIRDIILFYLMLCPCAAAWSVDSFRFRKSGPAVVSPWPICLLFTQMVLMYFMNGVGKVTSSDWLEGRTLYLVLHDLTLTRFSYAQLPLTYELTRVLTWTTLWWELSFPLLVLWRPTRIFALLMGVGFHIGIGLTMDLGYFAAYAICLYVPLVPWERISSARTSRRLAAPSPPGTPGGEGRGEGGTGHLAVTMSVCLGYYPPSPHPLPRSTGGRGSREALLLQRIAFSLCDRRAIDADRAADERSRDHVADEVIIHTDKGDRLDEHDQSRQPPAARPCHRQYRRDRRRPRRVAGGKTAQVAAGRKGMEAVRVVLDQRRVVVVPGLGPVAAEEVGDRNTALVGDDDRDAGGEQCPLPVAKRAGRTSYHQDGQERRRPQLHDRRR